MPIINVPPDPPVVPPFPVNVTPNVYSPGYQSNLIDTDVQQLAALMTHISGLPWMVDYYSQAIGLNQNLSAYQAVQLPPYQQYYLIKGYELRVSSALSTSQDAVTGLMTVTGSSVMYPFVIPNEGDNFVADVGDGRLGLFSITTVQRNTILKQTAYQISYTLLSYLNPQIQADLANKVILTNYFVKDYMVYGKNPVVIDSTYNDMRWIAQVVPTLLDRYLKLFYSPDFRTIIVPGQTVVTYDAYVVRTFLSLFDKDTNPILKKIIEYNVDGLQVWDVSTIWDLILKTDYLNRDRVITNMVLVPSSAFTYFGNIGFVPGMNYSGYNGTEGVYFSRIAAVVYPNIPYGATIDSAYNNFVMPSSNPIIPIGDFTWDGVTMPTNTATLIATTTPLPILPAISTIPIIHPVLYDSGYVLSNNFYSQAPQGQSMLELMVNDFINLKPVNTNSLLQIVKTISLWGKLEQYYYLPIVLILLKAALIQGPQS